MRAKALRVPVLTLALSAVMLLPSCGGSDDSSDSAGSSDATDTTAAGGSNESDGDGGSDAAGADLEGVDACALADQDLVQALGVTGEGTAEDRGGQPGIVWDTCRWGEIVDENGFVNVQVLTEGPDAVVNPLELLLRTVSSDDKTSPVDVGTDGVLYPVALVTGGGGVGMTIGFTADGGRTVAVSRSGEDVDVAALTALAQGVAANL